MAVLAFQRSLKDLETDVHIEASVRHILSILGSVNCYIKGHN